MPAPPLMTNDWMLAAGIWTVLSVAHGNADVAAALRDGDGVVDSAAVDDETVIAAGQCRQ